jgi:hypothetical protein
LAAVIGYALMLLLLGVYVVVIDLPGRSLGRGTGENGRP